jgi:CDP-diacylglycerol--glycerol-3-phosphate 3-phosphatidyltransferase
MAVKPRTKYWNLPNTLSMIRILTAPLLVVLLLNPARRLSVISAIIFALVCVTDWLDGYLARRMGLLTTLGKFLDPLADKLLIVTVFIMLIPLGRIPAWVVAIIIGREMAVTGLRAIASSTGVVIGASKLGKWKTVSQIICLVPLLLHYTFYGLNFHAIGTGLLVPAFGLTVWSGVDYFLKFFAVGLKES